MRIWMIAAVAAINLAIAGASVWFLLLREDEPQGHTDRLTLVVPAVAV